METRGKLIRPKCKLAATRLPRKQGVVEVWLTSKPTNKKNRKFRDHASHRARFEPQETPGLGGVGLPPPNPVQNSRITTV